MFILKKKYYLIIQSIKDINLKKIKKVNKFIIIYRNNGVNENFDDVKKFRMLCKLRLIDFYVANDFRLCALLKSDGIYLSSHNKSLKALYFKTKQFKIIGSAHNYREINLKITQGCDYILLSKLFLVSYNASSKFMGVIKFNNYINNISKRIVPLGGIKISNLNSLKNINTESFAVLSAIKKKPVNIINRLF